MRYLKDDPHYKVYGDWVIDLNWYEAQIETANTYGADVFVHLKGNEVCGLAGNDYKCRVCKTQVPSQMKMIIQLHHAKL